MTKITQHIKQDSNSLSHKQRIYEQALKDFPYPNLTATGGSASPSPDDPTLLSSLEYLFSGEELAWELVDGRKLRSGGMIEGWLVLDCRIEDGELRIEGVGNFARNGNWKKGGLLPEYKMMFAGYNIETRHWDFWVGR